jgi:hypothetical protein
MLGIRALGSRVASVLVVALLTVGVSLPAEAAATVDTAAVDAFVERQMAEHGIPGLAIALVEDDRVTYVRGYGDAGGGRRMTADRCRHRLSRIGNRQLNTAIHRIAITTIRVDPTSKAYLERAVANGKTKTEALRLLKRRISNAVYRDLRTDAQPRRHRITEPHPQRGLT